MTAPHITGMEPWEGEGGPIRAKIAAEAGPMFTSVRTDDAASFSNAYRARVARRVRAETRTTAERAAWIRTLAADLHCIELLEWWQ